MFFKSVQTKLILHYTTMPTNQKHQSDDIPVHLTAQELQSIELRRWLEAEVRGLRDDVKENQEVLNDIRGRVIAIEIKQDFEEKNRGLVKKSHATTTTTNPLNKSMGSFLGDVVVTALKTVAVAAASALMLLGYDLSRKDRQPPAPTPAYPPQPQQTQQRGNQP